MEKQGICLGIPVTAKDSATLAVEPHSTCLLYSILKPKSNQEQERYMLTLLTNMPREELIAQLYDGLVLMVLGMGTVFVFLVILIYASKLMSRICMNLDKNHPAKAASAPQAKTAAPVQQKTASAPATDDASVAAAIAAAWDKSKN